LQQDKLLLEAKLKEALAAQPAAVDPRELALAGQRITNLQKENDLLRVALDAAKARSAAGNTRALEQALAETNRKLAEQTALSAQLAREKEALQAGSKGSRSEAEAATLRAENALLKKQLAAVKAAPPATDQAQGAAQQLALARAQLAAMQSDKALLRLEKAALENRVKQLTAGAPAQPPAPVAAGPPRSEDAARVKQLQRERDDLQKKLEAALRELDSRKSKAVAARVREMETELAGLRARLSVYETKKVPYTSEELALFRTPETRLAQNEPAAARKSVAQVPSGMAVLAAEAQRHFQARQYDKAEEAYGQMLRRDQKSVYVLANLAAVQLEANHLPQAEKNIQQALSLAPEDPYSLAILGYLKFRQAKFDAALDALSRAAKLDPNNAEIQNYLGLTLSEKGMRGPAETALRKALDLDPMYASAHNNLAVIYITQQPPLVELARWHYQKALTAGHPRNPELEKMFQGKKAIE
jgi:Flp pilus assembly protein TadD